MEEEIFKIIDEKEKNKSKLISLVEELHLRVIAGSAAFACAAELYGNRKLALISAGIFSLSILPWYYDMYKYNNIKSKNEDYKLNFREITDKNKLKI